MQMTPIAPPGLNRCTSALRTVLERKHLVTPRVDPSTPLDVDLTRLAPPLEQEPPPEANPWRTQPGVRYRGPA